ncbi:MAG: hypothetical protein FWD31_14635, partial [Planctomycetaceae bacterium]|nr:hypothetical protein [Planctomycetaceae bacterium]
AGFVITEFQPPVPWAGKENTISCPGGHHFREGRWLHDPQFLNDYAVFWLRGGGALRSYSFWIADSIWKRALVTGDFSLAENLLPDLVRNHEAWERERLDPNGLFWQIDDRDGMEVSIGGSGYRATINSYMFGDALAISCIAARKGEDDLANKYYEKAITLKRLINENLWDQKAGFYKVAKRNDNRELPLQLADVRELHGYTPWYFDAIIPQPEYGVAWSQLTDPEGFFAPFGPTTAEQRHPGFKISYEGHECQWNGPSWPFATSMTLTSLANFIEKEKTANPEADISELQSAYLETLGIYARSHRIKNESMKEIAWIDENLNPFTGDWISRTRLKTWNNGTWDRGKGGVERGKDYNHSTFCDLVINGLIGFKPTVDDSFRIFPMVPDSVEFFCLDHLLWHGKIVTIFYDRTGERYHRGKGFNVYLDGKEVMTSENIPLTPVVVTWREYNK